MRRLPGCLGSVVGFGVVMGASENFRRVLPTAVLQFGAIVAGGLLVRLYGSTTRERWSVPLPDVVGVLKHDLSSLWNRQAADFRLEFAPGTSLGERALHELLYMLKWLGHFLIIVGLGTFLVSVMGALGITKWVALLW